MDRSGGGLTRIWGRFFWLITTMPESSFTPDEQAQELPIES
jgi:hypothetical protein